MSTEDIHEQLPAHISPARFDAYVEDLVQQALADQQAGQQRLRARGIEALAVLETPQLIHARRRNCQQAALRDIQAGLEI